MCNPAAFMAVQAVGTYINTSQNAAAANKQSKKNYEATVKLVGRQTVLKQHAVQQEQIQLAARAAEELNELSDEASKAYSLTQVSAGEGGVAGSGVEQVLSDFRAQEASRALTTIRNLENAATAADAELEGIQLSAESTLQNALPTEVEGGSLMQLAISLGGAYASGSAMAQANQLDAGIEAANVKLGFSDIFLKGPASYQIPPIS